jgi:hypothetical protein
MWRNWESRTNSSGRGKEGEKIEVEGKNGMLAKLSPIP